MFDFLIFYFLWYLYTYQLHISHFKLSVAFWQTKRLVVFSSSIFYYSKKMGQRNYIKSVSRDYDLASSTTWIVCVNLIHKWHNLQFKVDSEWQIFLNNFSWQFFFSARVFVRKLIRKNRRENICHISIWLRCLTSYRNSSCINTSFQAPMNFQCLISSSHLTSFRNIIFYLNDNTEQALTLYVTSMC